jgi:hypothetical protein
MGWRKTILKELINILTLMLWTFLFCWAMTPLVWNNMRGPDHDYTVLLLAIVWLSIFGLIRWVVKQNNSRQ